MDFLKSTAAKTSPELKKIKQELKKLTQDLTKLTGKSKGINEQRRDIRNQMRGLGNEMYHRKQQISYEILKEADVIVSTQTSSYDDTIERLMMNNPSGKDIDDRNLSRVVADLDRRYMQRSFFDVVILDEAAQSLEVSSWMPILLGTKAIFAGDHKQLPPTVKSKTAERKGFGRTLFEKLAEVCDHKCRRSC